MSSSLFLVINSNRPTFCTCWQNHINSVQQAVAFVDTLNLDEDQLASLIDHTRWWWVFSLRGKVQYWAVTSGQKFSSRWSYLSYVTKSTSTLYVMCMYRKVKKSKYRLFFPKHRASITCSNCKSRLRCVFYRLSGLRTWAAIGMQMQSSPCNIGGKVA